MSFYGSSFIFNDIPSEIYDLKIFDFDISNLSNSPSNGEVSIYEQWLYRREAPYFYGKYYQTSLEFDFTVGSYSYIDGASRNAIETWLLGKSSYLPLRIVQGDISDIVFNVILTKSNNIYIGYLNYATTLHAKCDRPWALYYPPTLTKTYISGSVLETFDYFNSSVYGGYNKPVIAFAMGGSGGNISIVNTSDSNREFLFENLSANEEITVDNDKGIISSSGSSLRMANFNKKFFRLIQGVNTLVVSGSITELTINSVFARGVGV